MRTPAALLILLTCAVMNLQGADGMSPASHPRGYVAYKAATPLHIDGKLVDVSWQSAPWTDDFVDIEGDLRPRPRFRTRAKMLWDDSYLYIGAELTEPHVWATLTQRDTVIFYDNDFEVFIDPNGDSHEYYEFEMNALNTVWDLFLPKAYKDRGRPDNSWDIDGLKTAVHVYGTINNPTDRDSCWCVEIAMPWSALKQFAHKTVPPAEGDQWRVNFSRVEWLHQIADGMYQKVKDTHEDNWVWSPQWVVNMHRPERWGYVQFSSKKPGTVEFQSDPAWEVKCTLHEVYYAQKAFRDSTKQWAHSLGQLRISAPVVDAQQHGLTLHTTSDGFVATMPLKLSEGETQQWHIRQDALLWVE